MARHRISAASRQQALAVTRYARLVMVLLVAMLALMVAGFWVFQPQMFRFRFKQPAQLSVLDVDTVYELDGKMAQPDKKYLLVAVRIAAVGKIGYAITPDRFELETSTKQTYRALPESPLFLDRGGSFALERGEEADGQLAFVVPRDAVGRHLRFPAP